MPSPLVRVRRRRWKKTPLSSQTTSPKIEPDQETYASDRDRIVALLGPGADPAIVDALVVELAIARVDAVACVSHRLMKHSGTCEDMPKSERSLTTLWLAIHLGAEDLATDARASADLPRA